MQSGEGNDEDLSRCPICQFIEAGECKAAHQVGFVANRGQLYIEQGPQDTLCTNLMWTVGRGL